MALIAATAFFVAAEFALVAVDRTRLERAAAAGSRRARVAVAVVGRLSFHLSGAQLGVTLCSLVLGVLAAPTFAGVFRPALEPLLGHATAEAIAEALGLAVATVASMVVGELMPKNLVMVRPQRAAQNLAGPLRMFSIAFAPIIWISNHMANFIVRRFGVEPRDELTSARSIEELELLVRSSAERGAIDPEAVTLVERSVRFGDKTAADALVPRLAVRALQRDDTVNMLVAASVETGFSRFPVYGVDLDDISGVVHVKDVYRLRPSQRHATPVTEIATPVLAVPETRPLDDLLADLRARQEHLAVVVDEHGGTAGIVTLEDLLEEIVGEIADEYDPPPTSITKPGPGGSVTLPGSLHPDEVRDASGFETPEGPYDTLAGFVLERLGHIPDVGEIVRHQGWKLTVAELDRRRIAAVRMQPPEDDSDRANQQQEVGAHARAQNRSITDGWAR